MDKIWYIIREKEHVGPYSLEDLQEFFHDNKIQLDTAIWKTGLEEPVPYRQIGDFDDSELKLMNVIEEYDYSDDTDEDEILDILVQELEEESPSIEIEEPPPLPPIQPAIQTMEIPREEPPKSSSVAKTVTNPEDPFGDDDDEVEAILQAEIQKEETKRVEEFVQEELVGDESILDDLDELQVRPLDESQIELGDDLEEGDDLSLDDFSDDEFERPYNKLKILLLIPAVIAMVAISKVGYEVYYIYFSKFSRPVGMMQRDYKRMTRMLELRGPSRSLTVSFAKDFSKLWAAINFPYDGRVMLELESVKEKVLTSDPILVTSSAVIEDKLVEFDKFSFEKGVRLYPGYYKLHIKLLNKKKLNFWIEKFIDLPSTFDITREVYIGKKTEEVFEKELTNFLVKRNSVDTKFWQDLFQRYDTLRLIVSQIHADFTTVIKSNDEQTIKQNIRTFEQNYKTKYGQFLTSFVLENQSSFKSVQSSVSRNKPQLISYHNKLANLSRLTGETSMDILFKLTTNLNEVKNKLMSKLVSIEIECKNAVSIIKQKM